VSKILVEIRVPAAERRCDVFIPYEAKLYEVTELVKALFADDDESGFVPTEDSILCDAISGAIFNVNLSPQELGLKNGSRLLLM